MEVEERVRLLLQHHLSVKQPSELELVGLVLLEEGQAMLKIHLPHKLPLMNAGGGLNDLEDFLMREAAEHVPRLPEGANALSVRLKGAHCLLLGGPAVAAPPPL